MTKRYVCKGCMSPCILEVGTFDAVPTSCPYNPHWTGAWVRLYSTYSEHTEDIKEVNKA